MPATCLSSLHATRALRLAFVGSLLAFVIGVNTSLADPDRAWARTGRALTSGAPDTTRSDESTARALCASCHLLPPPDVLPRSAWQGSVERMERIRAGTEVAPGGYAAAVALPADMQAALRHYERHAPAALGGFDSWPSPAGSPAFDIRRLTPPAAPPSPGVSNVELLDLDGDRRLELVVCDMRHGMVLLGRPYDATTDLRLLASMPHPARATAVDLDGDGRRDLLVADLGTFLPWDHDRGAVVWLRGQADGTFARFAIGGLPRVADVQAADVDGDGDLDLIVAAFGYRKTGQVLLLENRTTDWSRPAFAPKTIDGRPGALQVVPVDLDGDGRLDIVAVLAQEHEQVIAYMNRGGLSFEAVVLYQAPHPNWGSSGIEVVDLDGDGDLDVLLANGDTMDDSLLKPYHGVTWLENRGTLPFTPRPLARLPGAHRTRTVDLDGDGDLDIVVSAFVADGGGDGRGLASIVWLEQVARGRFESRTLRKDTPRHPTLAAADVNGDGRPDLVVGNMATAGPVDAWVEIWTTTAAGRPRAPLD